MSIEHFDFIGSSRLRWAEYDRDEESLKLGFVDGRTYKYINVGASTYRGLTLAVSAGQYFDRWIKDQFEFWET